MTSKIKLNLQMFADGGAGAAPAAVTGEAGQAAEIGPGVLEDGTQVDNRLAARMAKQEARRKARGQAPLYQAPVEQPEANTEQQAEEPQQAEEQADPANERIARWNELKKGEFKDLFGNDVQEIIQKRLKNQQDARGELDKLMPALNLLAKQRGIEEGNIDALVDSIEHDDSLIEDAAAEAGMTVESYRMMEQLRQENERYQQERQASQREAALRKHIESLARQAEELKARVPGFDLRAELQNDTFMRLTSPEGGLSVEAAYYAIHHREIEPQAMAYGIQRAQEQMAQTLQANRARPAEGALSGGQAATFQIDPRKMTKAERSDLIRRARRGERIEL